MHAAPYEEGTPTVISQIGKFVYGEPVVGHVLFYVLQAGTMLILVLAANTSFADFPRLASFHAGDNFMPRQLTKRGHRLVFSNGIISLAVAAIVLLVVTDAKVDRLIPLYAIGVFTSFTLSQAGMAKHHITHRSRAGDGACSSTASAPCSRSSSTSSSPSPSSPTGPGSSSCSCRSWSLLLVRLNRQYEAEAEELEQDAPTGGGRRPILRRHVVIVLVDELDVAAARAIQYARTLTPDDLRAVHFDLDPIRTEDLAAAWRHLGLSRLPSTSSSCPDRRIDRAPRSRWSHEELADGETEVIVLIPRRRVQQAFWHRLLHDRTADSIAEPLADLPHCNVTIVPYHLRADPSRTTGSAITSEQLLANHSTNGGAAVDLGGTTPKDCTPLGELPLRTPCEGHRPGSRSACAAMGRHAVAGGNHLGWHRNAHDRVSWSAGGRRHRHGHGADGRGRRWHPPQTEGHAEPVVHAGLDERPRRPPLTTCRQVRRVSRTVHLPAITCERGVGSR